MSEFAKYHAPDLSIDAGTLFMVSAGEYDRNHVFGYFVARADLSRRDFQGAYEAAKDQVSEHDLMDHILDQLVRDGKILPLTMREIYIGAHETKFWRHLDKPDAKYSPSGAIQIHAAEPREPTSAELEMARGWIAAMDEVKRLRGDKIFTSIVDSMEAIDRLESIDAIEPPAEIAAAIRTIMEDR